MRRLTFTVPDAAEGRIDRYLADVSELSRSYVQKLITEGHVTTGGAPIKANEPAVMRSRSTSRPSRSRYPWSTRMPIS